jgi:Tfp pilus assembly protein PilV
MKLTQVRNEKGFTLLSQLFAVSILTVLVIAMVALGAVVTAANMVTKHRTTSFTLAQNKIEDIRRIGYDYALAATTTVTEPYGSISGYPAYKRATKTVVNSPAAGMQTVTVTVSWNSDTRSFSLSTILAQ